MPWLRLQLVPPGRGGVRDFAESLQRLWEQNGVASSLLALDETAVRVRPLQQQLQTLTAAASPAGAPDAPVALLLHFSGYGYGRRGLCAWLADELAASRAALGQRLLVVTMFHELFASGPPWRSAYWLQPWQRRTAQRLVRLSDMVVTNSAHHLAWLRGQAPVSLPMSARPVFSNVGEPDHVPAARARLRHMVLFGAQATRARAAVQLLPHVAQLQALGLQGLSEIGPGQPTLPPGLPWPQRWLGLLPPAELSAELLQHRFALIDYPMQHLAKSSVFAAYAAHGCVVLNTTEPGGPADGLLPGRHLHLLSDTAAAMPDLHRLDGMAAAARVWYLPHASAQQAQALALYLRGGAEHTARTDPP
jgi:hypothetical protein